MFLSTSHPACRGTSIIVVRSWTYPGATRRSQQQFNETAEVLTFIEEQSRLRQCIIITYLPINLPIRDSQIQLVQRLFAALGARDHQAMATCYHEDAKFSDIAFDLHGRKRIHAMWHRICEGDIQVEVKRVESTSDGVKAVIVDRYTFTKTGHPVVNEITSKFRFRDGLIIEHRDTCNALHWARQAFGGIKGELAGRLGFLRCRAARKLMDEILEQHPQYR